MTHRTLQTVLRKLADTGPAVSDADLLRRFATDRDEAAFTLLVQRHGRLVWTVCRHLTRSDTEADDAFQATFLVLLRNAGKVRDAGKLSAWLHGVAYKVCSKARQSAKRRTTREAVTAKSERNGTAVPDSAWDRALAAVHEEVAQLPDALRVPFVLCCLEGKGQTEAAEQLGWKLGTLSGRLTRAKDAVLAKLDARGLTLGAVAAVGLAAPPSTVTAKAAALVQVGFAVPGSILQLSQGVIGMSANQVKLLAAGLLVACGLGVSGSGWLNTADAQSAPAKQSPVDRVKQLEEELAKAKKAEQFADEARRFKPTNSTRKWEYEFIVVSDMDQTRFMKFLQDHEDHGWDYHGTTAFQDGGRQLCWVFRRPKTAVKETTVKPVLLDYYRALGDPTKAKPVEVKLAGAPPKPADPLAKPASPPAMPKGETVKPDDWSSKSLRTAPKEDDPAAIDAEIKRLQDLRRSLAGKNPQLVPAKPEARSVVTLKKDEIPLTPADFADLLRKLGEKKFSKADFDVRSTTDSVIVIGSGDARTWVWEVTKKLSGK